MKIRIATNGFTKALGLTCNAVSGRASLPILSHVLLETIGNDKVKLVATDLEVAISCTTAVDVLEEGSITVPARKLFDILRELPPETVELSVGKNYSVYIRGDRASFRLMGLPRDDFPKLAAWNEATGIEIEQAVLKECLSLTGFAASHDETRYVLNGVLFSIRGGKLKLVGTDGRRLAVIEKPLNGSSPAELEAILPTRAVQELQRILGTEGAVTISTLNNQLAFQIGEVLVVSRTVEGRFPNYEQVIPKQEKTRASVTRESLLAAIRRTALLVSPESQAVKLDFSKSKLVLSSKSPSLGEAKEEIEADGSGQELAIGFNPQYLIDALKNLEVDQVSLSLTDSDKPGLLQGKQGYLYVIMPMQLN